MLTMLLIPAKMSWGDKMTVRRLDITFLIFQLYWHLYWQPWSFFFTLSFCQKNKNSGDQKGAIFCQLLNHYLCVPLFWSSASCLFIELFVNYLLAELFVVLLCHFLQLVFLALCPDVARLPEFQEMHGSGTDPPLCLMIGYTDGMQIWSISVSTF